jgi:hypothetical protein
MRVLIWLSRILSMAKFNPYLNLLMNPEEIQAIDKAQKERRNHIDNKTAKVE